MHVTKSLWVILASDLTRQIILIAALNLIRSAWSEASLKRLFAKRIMQDQKQSFHPPTPSISVHAALYEQNWAYSLSCQLRSIVHLYASLLQNLTISNICFSFSTYFLKIFFLLIDNNKKTKRWITEWRLIRFKNNSRVILDILTRFYCYMNEQNLQ